MITKEEKLAITLEQQPEALYRILNTLNFHDGELPDQQHYKLQYASIIYDLYICLDAEVPSNNDDLLAEILIHIENAKTEMQEIEGIEEAARYKLYCTIHYLDHLVDTLQTFNVKEQKNLSLEYEFVYQIHSKQVSIPEDPLTLCRFFMEWLVVQMSI